ncbi:MAG: ubiquitin-like small modifier protein 1 [Thermomicrobiales bacterium]
MSTTSTVNVLIPAPLRRFTGGESKVSTGGATVAELIDQLEVAYPGLKEKIVEDDGEIRRFVNVFVNGQNVRKLQGSATAVNDGDEVGIVPAMAGGSNG